MEELMQGALYGASYDICDAINMRNIVHHGPEIHKKRQLGRDAKGQSTVGEKCMMIGWL